MCVRERERESLTSVFREVDVFFKHSNAGIEVSLHRVLHLFEKLLDRSRLEEEGWERESEIGREREREREGGRERETMEGGGAS